MLRFLLPSLLLASSLPAQELPAGAFARLGGTALRHPERPLALAFRAGTSELASLGSDGTVRIWDTKTGKELHTFRQKDAHANGMAFSANGAYLAVHFGEKELWIYDAAKKYEKHNFIKMRLLDGMTITDDAMLVAGLRNGDPVVLFTANDLSNMELPPGTAAAVAPNGKSVALVQKDDGDSYPDILEVPSGKRMLKLLRKGAPNTNRIAYAPDSRTLAMASDNAAPIIVFQLGKEEPLAKIEGTGPVSFANANTLIGRKNGKLAMWNTEGKLLVENIGKDLSAYAVSGDGKLAATDSGDALGSPRIRLWSVADGKEMIFDDELLSDVTSVLSSPHDGIDVWMQARNITWIPTAPVHRTFTRYQHTHKDRPVLASALEAKFAVVEFGGEHPHLEILRPDAASLKLDVGRVHNASIHPEGKSFAVIGRDGFIRVWDAAGKELWTARGVRSLRAGVAYSPDGKTLAVTSIIRVALFNAADGKEAGVIGRQWEDGPFTSVCFNHDGSLIAAGTQGSAGSGNVYEVASLGLVKRCEGNSGSVIGVAFAAKSDVLVTAHSDDSLLAWKLVETPKAPLTLQKQCEALSNAEASVAWPAMMVLVDAKEKGVGAIVDELKKPAEKEADTLRKHRAAVVLNRIGGDAAKKVLEELK